MAIGATESDVQRQFLIEAVTLRLIGGLIGILIGVTAAFLMPYLLGSAVSVSMSAILIGVVFSAAVGLFFCYYLSVNAAGLFPFYDLPSEYTPNFLPAD